MMLYDPACWDHIREHLADDRAEMVQRFAAERWEMGLYLVILLVVGFLGFVYGMCFGDLVAAKDREADRAKADQFD